LIRNCRTQDRAGRFIITSINTNALLFFLCFDIMQQLLIWWIDSNYFSNNLSRNYGEKDSAADVVKVDVQ